MRERHAYVGDPQRFGPGTYGYCLELNPFTLVWEILCADGGIFTYKNQEDAKANLVRLRDPR
jgi:hypothetical protein